MFLCCPALPPHNLAKWWVIVSSINPFERSRHWTRFLQISLYHKFVAFNLSFLYNPMMLSLATMTSFFFFHFKKVKKLRCGVEFGLQLQQLCLQSLFFDYSRYSTPVLLFNGLKNYIYLNALKITLFHFKLNNSQRRGPCRRGIEGRCDNDEDTTWYSEQLSFKSNSFHHDLYAFFFMSSILQYQLQTNTLFVCMW